MAATYYTLLTKSGQAAIANATALNTPVNLTKMAVGDGGGAATTPKETQTALVSQKYISNINHLTIDASNPNYLIAEMIVPTTVGGWYVREVGIFDAAGNLFAVANFPETYKPQLAEGSGRDLVIRIVIQVSNSSAVTLLVDPAVTLASQSWVISNYVAKSALAGGDAKYVLAKTTATEQDFAWTDPNTLINDASKTIKGVVKLSSATDSDSESTAATPKAVKAVSAGRLLRSYAITASTAFTKNPAAKKYRFKATGAGGGGGGSAATTDQTRSCGGGGGAGATLFCEFDADQITEGMQITIGSPGAGGAAGGATGGSGSNGGDTLLGSLATAKGGFGGGGGSQATDTSPMVVPNGGNNANSTGGNILSLRGGPGMPGNVSNIGNVSGAGGQSFFGGGGNPISSSVSVNGDNGSLGGGGSGAVSIKSSSTGRKGGDGGNGVVYVEEYA